MVLGALVLAPRYVGRASAAESVTWLHVDGNTLKDQAGRKVILRGVNIESREWLWNTTRNIDFEKRAIPKVTGTPSADGWGANVVLLAFASGPVNRKDRTYLGFLDDLIALAKSNGAYTLLVWRYHEPDTYQPFMPDQSAQDALAALATRYEDEPAVLYGLAVEPKDVPWDYLKPRFTSMVDAIQLRNHRAVVAVPGTSRGRFVHWALTDPIDRDNLIYKAHVYDAWSALPEYRLPEVAARYPVILGEFGVGSQTSYEDMLRLLNLTEDHGISWVSWMFNDVACPCLLTDTVTWSATAYGAEVRRRLRLAAGGSASGPLRMAMVFDDTLSWEDWSWDTIVQTDVSAPAYAGARAMAVSFNQPWAGLFLHTPGFNTAGYERLEFVIQPGDYQSLADMDLALYDAQHAPIKSVPLVRYAIPLLNGWIRVAVPLEHLGGANTIVTGARLQEQAGRSQPTFLIDAFGFAA